MTLTSLIINCVERVLMSQGYTLERADSIINWAWADIEELILQYKDEVNEK